MKRYIYPGIGVLAVLGGGMLFMSLDERENLPSTELPAVATIDTIGTPDSSGNLTDNETPDDKGITDVKTEDTSVEKIPSEDPANDTVIPKAGGVDTGEVAPLDANGNGNTVSPSKEVKTRENGEIYFVDTKTGKEIETPEDTVNPPSETTDFDAPGKGSDADKTAAATAYVNHLNAIVDGDYETACEYILPQPEITNCAQRLANRDNQYPLENKYKISNASTINIDANNAYISPLALQNTEGKGTPAVKMVRSPESPNGWLLEDTSLISF